MNNTKQPMNHRSAYRYPSATAAAAFTLIELLVVIAIISILAAIIFPVFSTAQENARQSNTMEHMHDISSGMALYKLDNKSYPPVLFAFACDGATGDGCNTADTMSTVASDTNAKNELVGLYPEYVKDWHAFTCAADLIDDPDGKNKSASGAQPLPNYLQTDGTLAVSGSGASAPSHIFFLKDAFDVGPRVLGNNRLDKVGSTYTYMLRYSTNWTSYNAGYDASTTYSGANSVWNDYQRQLRWRNPPANTYVTGVTYHVGTANKLIVLYEGGNAKKADYQPANGNPDAGWDDTQTSTAPVVAAGCTASGSGGSAAPCDYVQAGFWRFDVTGR